MYVEKPDGVFYCANLRQKNGIREIMELETIFTFLSLASVLCFAQPTNCVGDWTSISGERKLTISTEVEGETVAITDASTTDTSVIDYYSGDIKTGELFWWQTVPGR